MRTDKCHFCWPDYSLSTDDTYKIAESLLYLEVQTLPARILGKDGV